VAGPKVVPAIVEGVDDLTPDWFEQVVGGGSVSDVVLEPIGGGLMAEMLRARIGDPQDGAQSSVIVKFTSSDVNSRSFASAMHMYELEVRFYREIAPLLPTASVPRCYYATLDEATGQFTLVLEDLSLTTRPGNVLDPCTVAECADVLDELAAIHAATWNSSELSRLPWLADPGPTKMFFNALPAGLDPLVERFGAKLEDEHVRLFRSVLPQAGEWVARWESPTVLQHGDFRSDNILFGDGFTAPAVTVVDFQTIRLGPPGFDLAYFIGSSLSAADRRIAERDLVNRYHQQLVGAGVGDFDADACWKQYRAGAMYGVLLFAGAASQVASTERGDRFIVDQAGRYAEMALDLDAPTAAGFA
jgi:aminoglycoside/choline kinase family phosphotransferase